MNNTLRRDTFDLKALLLNILVAEGTGFLSGLLSGNMREFYDCLIKPTFAPPGWVFLPVWVFLYFLMGVAAYRIQIAGIKGEAPADALFYYRAQLIFNFMWSILFFRFALLGVALLDLIVLLIMVMITTIKFRRIDKTAGNLMIPYLLWLIYALLLNYSFLVLNRMK